jgi:nicotinate-nucleotide adenylyltransferase
MVVTDIEQRWGVRFSIDLIEKLRVRFPGVRFVWIMGTDNLPRFHAWRRWRAVMQRAPIAFVPRPGALARARLAPAARTYAQHRRAPGALLARPTPAWTILPAPLVPLSSTLLRSLGARQRA